MSPSSLYPPPSHRQPHLRQPVQLHRPTAPVVHALPLEPDHEALLWALSPTDEGRDLSELRRRALLAALTGAFILALLMLLGALG